MPQPQSNTDPGRKVRVACNWIVGLLLAAIVAHVLLLPPKGEKPEPPPAETTGRINGAPLTLASTAAAANPLDASRAYGYLQQVCAIGPRISGTRGMFAQQKLIEEHFKPLADEIEFQRFQAPHPLKKTSRVRLANFVARWRPAATRRVLICAHYDTRPLPDQDRNPQARRSGVFIGANDGGSGVALLMEMAHLMNERFEEEATDPDFGVDFVLFDAEELVYRRSDPYFLGSQWFGTQYAKRKPLSDPDGGEPREWSYEGAVLLDMVADADLQVYWEAHSYNSRQTRPILQQLWAVADRLGVDEFVPRVKHEVLDDHLALRKYGGIRAVDLIDFDYPLWHTTGDTPDKCSGESMAKVGWVVWEWMRERGRPDAVQAE